MPGEALLRKTQADLALERAAMQLGALLHDAAAELDPFPSFPNAMFTTAIELQGPEGPDRGCIVVAQDGELYELEIGIDHDSIEATGSWDPVTARKEELKKVQLHPRDYVVYAYNGLTAITELLLEREEAG